MIANKNQPAKKLAVVFWFGFEGLNKGKNYTNRDYYKTSFM